jgi:Lar family restriction alleviation protein
MQSKKGCPFCQEKVIKVVKSVPPAMKGFQVECDNCGARGPIYENKEAAIEGWELGIMGLGQRMRKQ